jgi:hypothetical protein
MCCSTLNKDNARKLFAAVVLATLDDAIADDKKYETVLSRSPLR